MNHFTSEQLKELPSRYRANLMNSCTGYKPCNIIATKSKNGTTNAAIFNSIVHIGSNPPMIGFIVRPTTVPRNTYKNIRETDFFTINQVSEHMIKDAHHTAAKYDEDVSEFEKTNLNELFLDNFYPPYVQDSPIKLGCKYVNEYLIKENDTILVIGSVEHLYINNDYIHTDGWVQLDKAQTVASIGLDGYALPTLLDRFAYAKPDLKTKSLLNNS
ncbi:flavin oxidoreductase [Aquimarina sp. AD10]|uniref:flavin reductase family protein n=1 Tax=Aquimarina sp. AD10 TaxID=1714849 RepID=UPI000E49AF17|nr:flavin reductase [Aquimarina sp. AD10]AXT60765.1 flavin oxidoreductase [Aquimarina sp. AD10]RKM98535.1 flavin oxidoreductase [Aquimarina sp. AD10]